MMKEIDQSMIVYLDETGIDNNEVYASGWAPKGSKLYAEKSGKKTQRISVIGSLNNNKFIAPLVFEGYTNHDVFIAYLDKILIPILQKGQVIVMDNATFHKSVLIQQKIEDAGCSLKYLPAYSPDLNPIEHHWYRIKNTLRKNLKKFNRDLLQTAVEMFSDIGHTL